MFRRTQSVKRDLVTEDVTLKGRGLMHHAVSSMLAFFLSPVFSCCSSFDRPLIPANIDSFANGWFLGKRTENVSLPASKLGTDIFTERVPKNFARQRAR